MEFDIKGFIIALLLGILSGIGFANVFNLDFSTAIITAGTFMAGIGAVGTVYIAYRALHSWKEKVAYDTLTSSISNAMILLDRLYLDSSSLRLQTISLFKPTDGVISDGYLKHTLAMLEVVSKYNFCALDVELYSKQLKIYPKGIDSIIENRKSNVMNVSLKKVTDFAIYSNRNKHVDEEQLDLMVTGLYRAISKEKEIIVVLYRDLVNEF